MIRRKPLASGGMMLEMPLLGLFQRAWVGDRGERTPDGT